MIGRPTVNSESRICQKYVAISGSTGPDPEGPPAEGLPHALL